MQDYYDKTFHVSALNLGGEYYAYYSNKLGKLSGYRYEKYCNSIIASVLMLLWIQYEQYEETYPLVEYV